MSRVIRAIALCSPPSAACEYLCIDCALSPFLGAFCAFVGNSELPIEIAIMLCYTVRMARTVAQEQYQQYLTTVRWRIIRKVRRWLDGSLCRNCGYDRRLEVHHKTYRNRGRGGVAGMIAEVLDCVTLCHNCHQKAHGR